MRLLPLLALLVASSSAFTTPQVTRRSITCRFAEEASSAPAEGDDTPPPVPVKCPDCDLCDGSGKILGGIGVIAPWWPIKAYRPCPNFINNGGTYIRSGQPLDEIAFGRDSTYDRNA